MRFPVVLCVVGAVGAAACGADSSTDPGASTTPSYSVSSTGDRVTSITGFSLSQFAPNAWSEQTNGSTVSSDVTLMSFATLDLKAPQTGLGLLGRARVGTYRVRVIGAPLGAVPEFYGNYRIFNSDGTSSLYDATSGSVTITAVSPMIRGTFTFHSSRATLWPAVIVTPDTLASVSASLDVSGTFVAKVP